MNDRFDNPFTIFVGKLIGFPPRPARGQHQYEFVSDADLDLLQHQWDRAHTAQKSALARYKEADERHAARQAEVARQLADEAEERRKNQARQRYLEAGGTEADFVKDWPQIKREQASRAAVDAAAAGSPTERLKREMIEAGYARPAAIDDI